MKEPGSCWNWIILALLLKCALNSTPPVFLKIKWRTSFLFVSPLYSGTPVFSGGSGISQRGCQPQGERTNLLFAIIFAENCRQIKKGPEGIFLLIVPFPRVFSVEDPTVRPPGIHLSLHDDRSAFHHNPEICMNSVSKRSEGTSLVNRPRSSALFHWWLLAPRSHLIEEATKF